MTAEELIAQGYRRVSNKYRIVARIDREDWIDVVYEGRNPDMGALMKDFYRGADFTGTFSRETVEYEARSAADFYRRVCSRDHIEGVPKEIYDRIPSSDWDPIGYIPKEIQHE